MKKILAILVIFNVILWAGVASAAQFSILYLDQIGDDYQILIPGLDLSATFDRNQDAEDDGIGITPNDVLDPQGWSVVCTAGGNILQCLQPNRLYIFTDQNTGDTVEFSTDGSSYPSFAPARNTWRGDYGFLGSTSPLELSASVARGVQDTGVSLWPLFALVGVALAFVIAGLLVNFTKYSFDDDPVMKKGRRELAKSKAKSWQEMDDIDAKMR
jgi:hypothetical protein